MNLSKLFETQRKLDERIVKEKGLEGQNLLAKKILALQVELGELANEHRGFKFWSNDREPRTRKYLTPYTEQDSHLGVGAQWVNPLLEEAVDCLHFALSIGNDVGFKFPNDIHLEPLVEANHYNSTLEQFNALYGTISDLNLYIGKEDSQEMNAELYEPVLFTLLALTEKLGFTWEEIVEAYFEKNKVNHERQSSGY